MDWMVKINLIWLTTMTREEVEWKVLEIGFGANSAFIMKP